MWKRHDCWVFWPISEILSTWKQKTGGLRVQSHPGLHKETLLKGKISIQCWALQLFLNYVISHFILYCILMEYIIFISPFMANFPNLNIMFIKMKYFIFSPLLSFQSLESPNAAKEHRKHFYMYVLCVLARLETMLIRWSHNQLQHLFAYRNPLHFNQCPRI